jgi:tetratricopeptide (TPR) repeat protein
VIDRPLGEDLMKIPPVSALFLLLVMCSSSAVAQPDVPACEKGLNSERILACTELLQQERPSENQLVVRKSRGQAYLWSKQYDLAIMDFDAVLEVSPTDVDALYGRGYALFSAHEYERAVADADRLIGIGANVAAHQLRCRALAALGNFDEAIRSCTEQLRPYAFYIYLLDRARVYQMAGKYDLAVEDYNTILKVDKSDPVAVSSAVWGLGYVMFAKGNYAAALDEFDQAYRMEGDAAGRALALAKRGLANEALGRRLAAISDFQKALREEPDLDESIDGLKRLSAWPVVEKPWWRFW